MTAQAACQEADPAPRLLRGHPLVVKSLMGNVRAKGPCDSQIGKPRWYVFVYLPPAFLHSLASKCSANELNKGMKEGTERGRKKGGKEETRKIRTDT